MESNFTDCLDEKCPWSSYGLVQIFVSMLSIFVQKAAVLQSISPRFQPNEQTRQDI